MGFIVYAVVYIQIIVALLLFLPGIPPDYDFEAFEITPPITPEGWMASNTILDKAEIYFTADNVGPESVAVRGDEIFTGDSKGNIIKISNGKSSIVTQLQFPCSEDQKEEHPKCSWPLGVRFDNEGDLLVVDIHGGLIKVNVTTGAYETLVSKWLTIKGKASRNPEDLDIDREGNIYWSDGSTVAMGFTEFFGQPSGRLLKYNPKTKENTVLIEKIHLSNGVCLSEKQDFVLVSELIRSQIRRYYIKGEKAGQSDIFIQGLPGYPDNIRSNGKGGFYVALFAPWNNEFSWPFHKLSRYPLVRKLLLRSVHVSRIILTGMNQVIPQNVYIESALEYVSFWVPFMNWSNLPKTATIVELSNTGKITGILNGRKGDLHSISQITLGDKYAYINTPFDRNVWRIKIADLRKIE